MKLRTAAAALLLAICWISASPAEERADLEAIHRIKAEAFENSKAMDTLFFLTDVHGPRLNNSPGYRAAAEWTLARLKEWGLSNVKKENSGTFGRGWHLKRFSAHLIEPSYAPLVGFPLAWTQGTNGPLTGEPVMAPLSSPADFDKYKGKLKGKIVLTDAPREIALGLEPQARRLSEADLSALLMAPTPGARPPRSPLPAPFTSREEYMKFRASARDFLRREGAAATLSLYFKGDGGTVFGAAGGPWELKDPLPVPGITLNAEHYNRIARLIDKKIRVKVELEVAVEIDEKNVECFNLTGELPGKSKKDEVVILGGHFDSWHGGTGAADNAAGVAVSMEAARILKTLDLPLARTVRVAFWSGEEQGFLGSRAYVKQHFADRNSMQLKPAHARVAAYFNYDNGAGKIRGIYAQGNDMVRPIFEAWLAPLKDLGAATVSPRNTSGTDHLAFDEVGLPGFQFIQDPLNYSARVHHSNMDVYDAVPPGDLMQSAAVMAVFAYHAANREQMLPRKPLPKPQPQRGERRGAAPSGQ